jgi:hypothetical protein
MINIITIVVVALTCETFDFLNCVFLYSASLAVAITFAIIAMRINRKKA